MVEVRQTEVFDDWFMGLKDRKAKARVQARIDRLELGNFGDVAPVGEGRGGGTEARARSTTPELAPAALPAEVRPPTDPAPPPIIACTSGHIAESARPMRGIARGNDSPPRGDSKGTPPPAAAV